MKYKNIKIIAFDADDTLWVNEPYFLEAENKFCVLLEDYLPIHATAKELFKTEMKNLNIYGYGVKGFMLSMIETILNITNHKAPNELIEKTILYGKELLEKPIELIEGINETLDYLKNKYTLVVATKGDLLDQERKLEKSGLEKYFHHIEIMSDKTAKQYQKLITHLNIKPHEFLMIGNSIKSDILPVIEVGGQAIHIPYHTTWQHEMVHKIEDHIEFETIDHNSFLKNIL